MADWLALLEGSGEDIDHIKNRFYSSQFSLDTFDAKPSLSFPALNTCASFEEANAVAVSELNAINIALRIALPLYSGVKLHTLVQRTDEGAVHRFAFLEAFAVAKPSATGNLRGGTPIRGREERLTSLIKQRLDFADIAAKMAVRPLTWDSINFVYESAKGLTSARGQRKDYEGLIERGWVSREDSNRLYMTAAYHRHGHPKAPNRSDNPISYDDARKIIARIFWGLVDELEPA